MGLYLRMVSGDSRKELVRVVSLGRSEARSRGRQESREVSEFSRKVMWKCGSVEGDRVERLLCDRRFSRKCGERKAWGRGSQRELSGLLG